MFSVWFVGFLLILVYRIFNAGMNSKDFYKVSPYRSDNGKTVFDESKAIGYTGISIIIAIFWIVVLPVTGIYMLGKSFQKENDTTNK